MGITPEVGNALVRHEAEKIVGPNVYREVITDASRGYLFRLAQMTGKGVVPGVPAMPKFQVVRLTTEQRAERRRLRREGAAGEAEVQEK